MYIILSFTWFSLSNAICFSEAYGIAIFVID